MTQLPVVRDKFSVEKCLSDGWKGMISHFLPLFGVMVVSFLVMAVATLPTAVVIVCHIMKLPLPAIADVFLSVLGMVAGFVVGPMMQMGMLRACLKVIDNETPSPKDLFVCWPYFWQFFSAGFLMKCMRFPAYLCFIFPGIWLDLSFRFYEYFVVDRGMGPIQAFRASNQVTKGTLVRIALTEVILLVVAAIGGMVLIVGAVPAAMIVMLARASMYRQVLQSFLGENKVEYDPDDEARAFDDKLRRQARLAGDPSLKESGAVIVGSMQKPVQEEPRVSAPSFAETPPVDDLEAAFANLQKQAQKGAAEGAPTPAPAPQGDMADDEGAKISLRGVESSAELTNGGAENEGAFGVEKK